MLRKSENYVSGNREDVRVGGREGEDMGEVDTQEPGRGGARILLSCF